MNPLFKTTLKGTLGEILAQAHLLAHGVQAAPPVKDSGNDLIAVKDNVFRAVQVRTSTSGQIHKPSPECLYHILAVVHLPFDGEMPQLAQTRVFLFKKEELPHTFGTVSDHQEALLSDDLVMHFWQ